VLHYRGDASLMRVTLTHRELHEHYSPYAKHHTYFWGQVPQGLQQHEFNVKFETLLLFLVEAIGVPVLLSLLLLAYSSISEDVCNAPQLHADTRTHRVRSLMCTVPAMLMLTHARVHVIGRCSTSMGCPPTACSSTTSASRRR
jgi:hypothetical protein